MNMQKLALVLALGAMSTGAFAAGDNFYVGGAIGRGAHDVADLPGASVDESDTGYKLFGGYRFSKELAVEVGYFDFGQATAKVGSVTLGKYETSAFGAGVAFTLPFADKWSGIGRLGLASVKTKATVLGISDSEDNIKVYGGLGIGYAITPQINIQGTWDFTQGEVDGESGRVDLLAVGVTFSF